MCFAMALFSSLKLRLHESSFEIVSVGINFVPAIAAFSWNISSNGL